jgi:hypothetical protein
MVQRCDTGLCYNCPTKYSKGHAKECTMKGIYLLEVVDNAMTATPRTSTSPST